MTPEQKQRTVSNDTQVKQEDRELIEAIAGPWICAEAKPCEEAVAVHWEEMLTSLTASLAAVRREERESFVAILKRWCKCGPRISCSFCAIKRELEASANKKGEGDADKD